LRDTAANPRAQHALLHRSSFREALAWMAIHSDVPAVIEHWNDLLARRTPESGEAPPGELAPRRRRRRRRRRFRPMPTS
jgi:hypothetical protein